MQRSTILISPYSMGSNYFLEVGAFDSEQIRRAKKYIINFDNSRLLKLLSESKHKFSEKLKERNANELGSEIVFQQIDILTGSLFMKLGIL